MKRIILALALILAPIAAQPQTYHCPDDGCQLIYTGQTIYGYGPRWKTVEIWRCMCCSKRYMIYIN